VCLNTSKINGNDLLKYTEALFNVMMLADSLLAPIETASFLKPFKTMTLFDNIISKKTTILAFSNNVVLKRYSGKREIAPIRKT